MGKWGDKEGVMEVEGGKCKNGNKKRMEGGRYPNMWVECDGLSY